MTLAHRLYVILQSATMRLPTKVTSLGSTTPAGLAGHLLTEISKGQVPVYPTTERIAERLVTGLVALQETRPLEVHRAVLLAPRDGNLDWPDLMRPVTTNAPFD